METPTSLPRQESCRGSVPARAPSAASFDELVAVVQACRRCPAMDGRRRVLGPASGSLHARVLFVGEAPGRLGAERTGVPFSGDVSGRRFQRLLAAAGWSRSEVFVTNAVLCNPRREDGRNRPPTRLEVTSCREHLAMTLHLVRPVVVVALGRKALAALAAVAPHQLGPGTAPGVLHAWGEGRWLAWLLHPSPLTQVRRTLEAQAEDWRALRAAVDALAR